MRQILADRDRISEWLLCFYVFFLPWLQQGSIVAIILLAVIILTSVKLKEILINVFQQKVYLFLLLFYGVHAFGLLYTENFSYAFFDLGIKLSFFLGPFLFAGLSISEEILKRIKLSFVTGCILSILISLTHSIYLYHTEHWINDFFYEKFSWFNHPTYITIYVNIALLFLLEYLFRYWREMRLLNKSLLVFAGYILVAAIIMYSSRTGSAVSGFTLLLYTGILLKKYFRGYIVSLLAMVLVIISTSAMYYYSLSFFDRYSELKTELKEEKTKLSGKSIGRHSLVSDNSASSRVLVWLNSWELIQENWLLGVGTGDIKDELVKKSIEHDWAFGTEKKLNPHNQYLHTWLSVGLLGLIVLMLNFIYPLFFALKRKHWIYSLFLLIVILNCLTESVLEVQRGVLLFPFFSSMFFNTTPIIRN